MAGNRKPSNRRNERIRQEKQQRAIRKAAEHQPKNIGKVAKEALKTPQNAKLDSSSHAKEKRNINITTKGNHECSQYNNDHMYKNTSQAVETSQKEPIVKISHVPSTFNSINNNKLAEDKPKQTKKEHSKPSKKENPGHQNTKKTQKQSTAVEGKTKVTAQQKEICTNSSQSKPTNEPDPVIVGAIVNVNVDVPNGSDVIRNNIPPAPTAEKKRIKEFVRKTRYKRSEANKESEFSTPDIQRLLKLPKGHHANMKVIETLKKKYTEAEQKNKKDREELKKEIRQGSNQEFILKRNNIIRQLTLENFQKVARKTTYKRLNSDTLKCPDVEKADKILKKLCRLKKLQVEAVANDVLRTDNAKDHYYRLLPSYNDTEERFNFLESLRVNDRFGINVNDKQVKLLESMQRNLSTNVVNSFSKRKSTPVKEWRKKILKHNHVVQHLRTIVDEMVEAQERKYDQLSLEHEAFKEVEKECLVKENKLEEACALFEKKVMAGGSYKKVANTNKTLRANVASMLQQKNRVQHQLRELRNQLTICQNTPKSYDGLAQAWMELREPMIQRTEMWIEKRKKQEILKEMIRVKTGVILKAESKQFVLQKELDESRAEHQQLGEQLKVISCQRKKLNLKYKRFADFVPLSQPILSI